MAPDAGSIFSQQLPQRFGPYAASTDVLAGRYGIVDPSHEQHGFNAFRNKSSAMPYDERPTGQAHTETEEEFKASVLSHRHDVGALINAAVNDEERFDRLYKKSGRSLGLINPASSANLASTAKAVSSALRRRKGKASNRATEQTPLDGTTILKQLAALVDVSDDTHRGDNIELDCLQKGLQLMFVLLDVQFAFLHSNGKTGDGIDHIHAAADRSNPIMHSPKPATSSAGMSAKSKLLKALGKSSTNGHTQNAIDRSTGLTEKENNVSPTSLPPLSDGHPVSHLTQQISSVGNVETLADAQRIISMLINDRSRMQKEVEDLTSSLFQEANQLVRVERARITRLEERIAAKSQMNDLHDTSTSALPSSTTSSKHHETSDSVPVHLSASSSQPSSHGRPTLKQSGMERAANASNVALDVRGETADASVESSDDEFTDTVENLESMPEEDVARHDGIETVIKAPLPSSPSVTVLTPNLTRSPSIKSTPRSASKSGSRKRVSLPPRGPEPNSPLPDRPDGSASPVSPLPALFAGGRQRRHTILRSSASSGHDHTSSNHSHSSGHAGQQAGLGEAFSPASPSGEESARQTDNSVTKAGLSLSRTGKQSGLTPTLADTHQPRHAEDASSTALPLSGSLRPEVPARMGPSHLAEEESPDTISDSNLIGLGVTSSQSAAAVLTAEQPGTSPLTPYHPRFPGGETSLSPPPGLTPGRPPRRRDAEVGGVLLGANEPVANAHTIAAALSDTVQRWSSSGSPEISMMGTRTAKAPAMSREESRTDQASIASFVDLSAGNQPKSSASGSKKIPKRPSSATSTTSAPAAAARTSPEILEARGARPIDLASLGITSPPVLAKSKYKKGSRSKILGHLNSVRPVVTELSVYGDGGVPRSMLVHRPQSLQQEKYSGSTDKIGTPHSGWLSLKKPPSTHSLASLLSSRSIDVVAEEPTLDSSSDRTSRRSSRLPAVATHNGGYGRVTEQQWNKMQTDELARELTGDEENFSTRRLSLTQRQQGVVSPSGRQVPSRSNSTASSKTSPALRAAQHVDSTSPSGRRLRFNSSTALSFDQR